MTRIILAALVLVLLLSCAHKESPRAVTPAAAAPELTPGLAPLETALRALVAPEQGDFGIVVLDPRTMRMAAVNETLVMHAASTMKLGVLYELYRQAATGERPLDTPVTVKNRFRSIADTSTYTLSAADDGETDLYERVGQALPVRELARRMIVRSSNLATNNVIELVGAPRVRGTLARLGASTMNVQRGVEDGPAYRAGMNNTTDALGFARALASLARCELLPRELCNDAVEILAQQEFNTMIPGGLPPGTRFAHKTGSITGIAHDGGIVYNANGEPLFVIVVLTRNAAEGAPARIAAAAAKLAWDALGPEGSLRPRFSAPIAEGIRLAEQYRLPVFTEPPLRHAEYWGALEPVIARGGFNVEPLGNSSEGRSLRLVHVGSGPMPVLLWSQMHGDETTATRALADLLNYMASEPDAPRVRAWKERLHLLILPMLNPDGAERHTRRNAYGIDVNRDARLLVTPEGRTLKAVQEKYRPAYGFNLHDQNPRTRVGNSERLAAISLLAPPPDGSGKPVEQWLRSQRLVAYFGQRIEPMVAGHITRYDDSFNPRAFGDLMSSWGVSTVLIESGGWAGDPVKRWLRTVNFVAIAEALDAIAADAHATAATNWYHDIAENGRSVNDLLIRGGQVQLADEAPYSADLVLDFAGSDGQLVDAGDMAGVSARDTIDARGLTIQAQDSTGRLSTALLVGRAQRLLLVRGARDTVWEVWNGRALQRAR